MVAVILGINGVGKSSVVKEVIGRIPFQRIHWGHVSEMLAKPRGLINHIDELRNIDIRMQKFIQDEAADVIQKHIEANPGTNYIIETHAALKTSQGYLPGLNFEVLKKLKPEIFIIVESDSQSIWNRRVEDTSRVRTDDTSVFDVETNLKITRNFATSYAIASGATLAIVENKQGDVNYAVEKIVGYLKMFLSDDNILN